MNIKSTFFLFLIFFLVFLLIQPVGLSKAEATTSANNLINWESSSEELEDTFISGQNPNTNYSSSQYLVTGKHSSFGSTTSFLKFKLPLLPEGAIIKSAKLSLYQYYNSPNQALVDIRPVNSTLNTRTVNWNTRPTVGPSISNAVIDKPAWSNFYITSLVSSWYNGTPNNGLAVQFRDITQPTKIFYSNDHNTYIDYKPKLTITYVIPEVEPEYRALWVDMFHDGAKTPAQVDQLIKDAQTGNINTIFLQVRRRGDAFYSNSIEPKTEDHFLQTDYDPLADLIEKAHTATPKIQIHAWFAMMPIWNKSVAPKDPKHIFNSHGFSQSKENNWLSKTYSGSYTSGADYVIDPGHPEAVDYTKDVIMHVVNNYDIDGIQMDLVRYMGEEWGYNDVNVERFNQVYGREGVPLPSDSLWKQWRRDQVTNMVRNIYTTVQSVKPAVTVSAATITWGNGPRTQEEWDKSSTMNSALQDWKSWLQEGLIDLVIPMNYFRAYDSNEKTYYNNWIEWQKNNQGQRMIVAGLGNYLNSIPDSINQIKDANTVSNGKSLGGTSLYSYAVTNKDNISNTNFYQSLSLASPYNLEPVFPSFVPVPNLPWKSSPTKGHLYGVTNKGDHQLVEISGSESRSTFTDGKGDFQILNLNPGNYEVKISDKVYKINIEIGKVIEFSIN